MIRRIRELETLRVEARGVGGEHVAASGAVGGDNLVRLLEGNDLILHVVGAEVVGDVKLGGRAGIGADTCSAEFRGVRDAERLRYHEALAVIVGDAREIQAEVGVARHRPGRVAAQDIDLARLQRGEALLGRERLILDLAGIAENRGGERLAIVDVDAAPVAGGDRGLKSPGGPGSRRRSTLRGLLRLPASLPMRHWRPRQTPP